MLTVNIYPQGKFMDTTIYNDDNVDQYSNEYFICINSTGWVHSIPHFEREHDNVLNLWFDDVEKDMSKSWGPNDEKVFHAKACTTEQAKQIKNFINNIPNNSTVHVYCAKGKSRSVAVGMYIRKFINKEIIDNNISFNKHVFGLLENV